MYTTRRKIGAYKKLRASTDGTVESIRQFEKRTKYTCKWISEKDKGIYDAMNKGYALSTGEIIAFFNDLFLIPHAVTLMAEAIESGEYDGAHADLIFATDSKVKLAYVLVTIIRMFYGGTSTENMGSYVLSLRESHRALKENGVKGAWWIDIRRTIKVLDLAFTFLINPPIT